MTIQNENILANDPDLQDKCEFKRRLLGRIGQKSFIVNLSDARYFQVDGKVVFLIDTEGTRFLIDYSLDQLQRILNPFCFFRVNRKYIVHCDAIEYAKPYPNNRLRLIVKGMVESSEFIVSRSRVAAFKAWVEK